TGRQAVERANPIDMKGALKLGLVIFGLLAITAIVQKNLGSDAVGIVSFLSGLFELHGVTFANATMHQLDQMSLGTASIAIYMAVSGAYLSKIGIVCAGRSRKFATWMIFLLTISYAIGGLVAFAYW